jgi:hypothetical protein
MTDERITYSRQLRLLPIGTVIANGPDGVFGRVRFRKTGTDAWRPLDPDGNEYDVHGSGPGFTFKSEAIYLPADVVPADTIDRNAVRGALRRHQICESSMSSDYPPRYTCTCGEVTRDGIPGFADHQSDAVIAAVSQHDRKSDK